MILTALVGVGRECVGGDNTHAHVGGGGAKVGLEGNMVFTWEACFETCCVHDNVFSSVSPLQ